MPEDKVDSLWKAIIRHATQRPVLVLRRSDSLVSSTIAERLRFYEFSQFEVRPLSEVAVARFLRERFTWYDSLSNAVRPDILRRMLTNPLQLHIAAETWSRDEPPSEVLEAADPSEALWTRFVRDKLNHSAIGQASPWLRRTAQALALSAPSTTTTLTQAFHDPRIRPITILVLCVIGLPLGWWMDLWTVTVVVITLVGIAARLSAYVPSRLFLVPIGRLAERQVGHLVVTAVLYGFAFMVIWPVMVALWLITASVSVAVDTADLGIWSTVGYAFDIWWYNLFRNDFVAVLDFVTLGWIWILTYLNFLNLSTPQDDFVKRAYGWAFFPFRHHLWLRVLIVGVLLLVGVSLDNWVCLALGLIVLATVVHETVRFLMFAVYCGSVRGTMRGTLRDLEVLGLVYQDRDRFRFVHAEVADNIAIEALRPPETCLENAKKLSADRGASLLERRCQYSDVSWMTPVVRDLMAHHPSSAQLLSIGSLYLTYAVPDPPAVVSMLRRYVHRWGHTTLEVHLAEAYQFAGDLDRADQIMTDTVRRNPDDFWVVRRGVSMAVALDDVDRGVRLLQDFLQKATGAKRAEVRMELVLLQLRTGRMAEDQALEQLTALSAGHLWFFPTLEIARLHSELEGDHDRAIGLLDGLGRDFRDSIVSARLAQTHLRAGNHDQVVRHLVQAARELSWLDWPHLQLESAVTVAAATGSPLATEVRDRLTRHGWRIDPRLAAVAERFRGMGAAEPTGVDDDRRS